MAFIETPRFSEKIMQGAIASMRWQTDVIQYGNGTESRNANWQYPLKQFDIPNVDDSATTDVIVDWFMITQGRLDGFRVKDHTDYKSAATITNLDQTIGTGDGIEVDFQLIKTYSVGANDQVRQIKKPVSGTVTVAVNGVAKAGGGTDYTLDTTTGIITFNVAPADTLVVTAGYEFDVPVRFDTDQLDVRLLTMTTHSIDSVPMVELRS